MNLEITNSPTESDKEAVENGLSKHATKSNHPWNDEPLGIFYRDDNGVVLAGLTGETVWGWLCIKHIWVSEELRGKGIGKSLIKAAEEEARKRGCSNSTLDTFTFQAPEFYENLGYEICGKIENFPKGRTRFFYSKKL